MITLWHINMLCPGSDASRPVAIYSYRKCASLHNFTILLCECSELYMVISHTTSQVKASYNILYVFSQIIDYMYILNLSPSAIKIISPHDGYVSIPSAILIYMIRPWSL